MPVTGGAQTGFTSPTYTISVDIAPTSLGKQWAVTALGGTQTGVTSHSISKPFTITFFRPAIFRTLSPINPLTGALWNVPNSELKIITRKGAIPLANQAPRVATIRTFIDIPAGTDTYEPSELRALLSLHIGALNQISSGLGDSLITGIV